MRQVLHSWGPLAASWILMAMELPAVSAVMARLPQPRISLAAYGGIVFPLSMIVEAPIIMLLSASTALSKDKRSFALLRRFMFRLGAALTAIHLLVALTPLYGLVVGCTQSRTSRNSKYCQAIGYSGRNRLSASRAARMVLESSRSEGERG
jgi:hypothetical protein